MAPELGRPRKPRLHRPRGDQMAIWISRPRVVAALVAGAVGLAIGAATGVILGYDSPVGLGLLGAASAGLAGASLAPSIAANRPLTGVALALLTYFLGVLLYPWFSTVFALHAADWPFGKVTANSALEYYPTFPLGFLVALPLAPAVVVTGMMAANLIDRAIPATDADTDDEAADNRFRRRIGCLAVVILALPAVGWALLALLASRVSY